jgi:hypothetical protein
LGEKLQKSMRNAWDSPLNTHLGYRYDRSPVCIPDGPPPPEPEDSRVYVQSSHPGARAPHAWLADGRSTLDLFGKEFVLLDTAQHDAAVAALYEKRYVLVRPDGHVAWRGDAPPPQTVLDRSRGATDTVVNEEERIS